MKNENISTTTLLLAFNILLVLIGLLMINKKILNNDEQSSSLKAKIDQIETQLDVLIDDSKTAREKVIVANEDNTVKMKAEMKALGMEATFCVIDNGFSI